MTEAASVYPPLEARPIKNTICLFDVDKTLSPARGVSLMTQDCPETIKAHPIDSMSTAKLDW